jgi:hypothetical protein
MLAQAQVPRSRYTGQVDLTVCASRHFYCFAVYQALRSHHLLNVGTTEFEPERRPDRTRSLPTHDFEVGDENRAEKL